MKKWKISLNAPVILTFVAISFVAMLLHYFTNGRSNELLFMTYHSSLREPLTYVRFFTHVLGHADWGHYIGNMAYLLLLGPILEEKYGSWRVLQVIGITAVVTGVLNYILFPHVALCGASGVCFAFILWVAYTGFRQREIPLTFILVAAIFIGQQVYEGVTIQNNISNMSHIVGGILGSVAGFVMNRKRGKR